MFRVERETSRYKVVVLYETEQTLIVFVEQKNNNNYDRIRIVRYGDRYSDPQEVIIFRYEDEQFVNHMVETFRNQEENK